MEKNRITVRDARPSDAPAIARLIVMAWPVEVFLEHGRKRTVEDLVELVTDIVSREETLYSYTHTVVAEDCCGSGSCIQGMRNRLVSVRGHVRTCPFHGLSGGRASCRF